jgi:zinc D-Ala-D-Ala carboxypeptidase
MSQTAAARSTTRTTRSSYAAGVVLLTAAVVGILASWSPPSAPPTPDADSPGTTDAVAQAAPSSALALSDVPRIEHGRAPYGGDGAVTAEDGALPDGATVFDDEYPGIANLDPDLLHALRLAATDAADAGIGLYVNSGWRSAEYQRQLFREAVSKYGSEEEASRWVATPVTSPHVSGDAVDIGSVEATAWLRERGAEYALCQIYRNEPWHYELRPTAIDSGCPRMYPDSSHDPRLQP